MRGKPLEPPSTAHKQRITPAGAGKTPPFTEVCRHYDRITPAGAGKTTLKSIKTAQTKDHPRRCGENALGASAACRCAGSPPQVRGKLGDLTSNFIFSRITPAGAGKTHCSHSFAPKSEDHPRGCGENNSKSVATSFVAGSPPRMRGKHHVNVPPSSGNRITPADAGKTHQSSIMKK